MLDTSGRGRRLKPALPSPKIRLTHSPTTVTTHLCAMTYENFTSRSIATAITGTCHGSSARRHTVDPFTDILRFREHSRAFAMTTTATEAGAPGCERHSRTHKRCR